MCPKRGPSSHSTKGDEQQIHVAVTLTITLEQGIVFSAFHGVNEAVLRGRSEVDIAGRMQRFEQNCSISKRLMGLAGQGQQEMFSKISLQNGNITIHSHYDCDISSLRIMEVVILSMMLTLERD